jgi:creatinine amidohydrolase
MLIESLSWREIEQHVRNDTRVAIVLGATEQHSDLSVCTDTLIPFEIAKRACDAERVVLITPIPFGLSAWSNAFPGTITLRTTTFAELIKDVTSSLLRSGFRRIVVLNGHGVNRAMTAAFGESINDVPDAEVWFHQWWELPSVVDYCRGRNLKLGHANWAETFPFTMTTAERRCAPFEGAFPNLLQSAAQIRKQLGEGHAAGPLDLGEETACALLKLAVADFRGILRDAR